MRLSIVWIGIGLVVGPMTGVWAQSISPQQSSRLQGRLERVVAAEDWDQAVEIVDQLIEIQPQDQAELQAYRQRLLTLAENAPPQVEILSVRGEVFSTRTERRQRVPDSRFRPTAEDIAIVFVPGFGPVVATEYPVPVQLPDQYSVEVSFSGSVSRPETVEASITLAGGGQQTQTRRILVGGTTPLTTETFVFSSQAVPAPNRVLVEIKKGPSRSFSLGLPDRNTILGHGDNIPMH